ncbi:MAG: Uma2 family endonuclease [Candidatus Cloacimonetes bacterium]|nr:Uma2 family endonuclease [Candidatus Cloacimonadota bacterium]
MSTALKGENKDYTYADYLTFPDEDRVEIIDGVVYDMSPAPRPIHQEYSINLQSIIWNYLKDKRCKIYPAPFDVRLSESEKDFEIRNVVQPDISVICDTSKIDDKGCKGAPDWIIEILSPSTASKDIKEKFKLYEKYGVKEYWIVEPSGLFVQVFVLNYGKYEFRGNFTSLDYLTPTIFEDLKIDLAEVFGVERKEEERKGD